jgi:hypothetical protein
MRRPVSVKDVFSFCFLFPSCGFLRIRAGPPLSPSFHPYSWLSDFRSVHGGRSPYSRCCYLIFDLGSRLSTEAGPGVRRSHLISAVELGCLDTISLLSCMLLFLLPAFPGFPQRNFELGSPSNDDRQFRRPLASPFGGEFFTLGRGAYRFLAIAQWFVHLSTHPQPMQQYR